MYRWLYGTSIMLSTSPLTTQKAPREPSQWREWRMSVNEPGSSEGNSVYKSSTTTDVSAVDSRQCTRVSTDRNPAEHRPAV